MRPTMGLPIHLQMEIDIHAQLHHKEIAESFARLREAMLPEQAVVFVNCKFYSNPDPGHIVLAEPCTLLLREVHPRVFDFSSPALPQHSSETR